MSAFILTRDTLLQTHRVSQTIISREDKNQMVMFSIETCIFTKTVNYIVESSTEGMARFDNLDEAIEMFNSL